MLTVTEQTVRVDSNKDDSKNLNMTEDSDKVLTDMTVTELTVTDSYRADSYKDDSSRGDSNKP